MVALALPPDSATTAVLVFEWPQRWPPWTAGFAQETNSLHLVPPLLSSRWFDYFWFLQLQVLLLRVLAVVVVWYCCSLFSKGRIRTRNTKYKGTFSKLCI